MTQTYIIRPGSIASVQYITLPDGQQATAVFLGPDPWLQGKGSFHIETPTGGYVPEAVLDEIVRRFTTLFRQPSVADRYEALRHLQPVEIQA